MNVTRAGFAVSYFVSHTCWQPLPQRVNSVNANDSTAAGIKRLRRLKFKRCGELASRLSSLLTFAYVYVVVRAIHPGKEYQRGLSCNSPDSQYANTDMCGDTPAAICCQNEGTCTRNHSHLFLCLGIHCQVNCTSALLDFVPCNVDVGAPIWAGRYMAETAEKKSEDDGVDCEDIRAGADDRGGIPSYWRWT